MSKTTLFIWALTLAFVSGCGGTSCTTKQEPQSTEAKAPVSHGQPVLPDGELLTYREILTGGAKSRAGLPLIIAVHGLGDRPKDFASLFDGLPFEARVVLPRAPEPWGGGWAWFPYRFRDQNPVELAAGIRTAAGEVAALAQHLSKGSSTKPIICGFSQGGMISYAVALLHPHTISGAVPISGTIPGEFLPGKTGNQGFPPIRALHGTVDQVVTFPPTKSAVEKMKANGLDIELEVYPGVGHTITQSMRRNLYKELRALAH